MTGQEKRIHARVQVKAEVRIAGQQGFVTGELRDMSKGGAAILLPEKAGELGDVIELFLPFPQGIEIAVMAEILRLEEKPEGIVHGFRFTLIEPAMQEKLLGFLEILSMSPGGKARKHSRVVKRLPVTYGKLPEFKAMLQNISMGGLAMLVETPLVLYQEIEISVPDASGKELLILPGRVIYQHPMQRPDGSKGYQIGLQFKELSSAAKVCLQELLNHVLGL